MSENNEPLFCLADVCQILDLIPSKVAQRLDKDVLSKYPLETSGGVQQANFVNQKGSVIIHRIMKNRIELNPVVFDNFIKIVERGKSRQLFEYQTS